MKLFIILLGFSVTWHTYFNSEMINTHVQIGDSIFLGTNGGVLKTIPGDSIRVVSRYTNLQGVKEPVINSMDIDSQGNIWACSDHIVYFKKEGEDYFEEYPNIVTNGDSLTSIVVYGQKVFVGSATGVRVIFTNGTPDNFSDDGVYGYSGNLLPITSDSILKIRIFDDTLYFSTPLEVCYGPADSFPDRLIRIPSDSLPGTIGRLKRVIDFYKGEKVFAMLTKTGVIYRGVDGTWRQIQNVNFRGQTYWFCGYHALTGLGDEIYIGLSCLLDSRNNPLNKLGVVRIDSSGAVSIISPDSIACMPEAHVTHIIPLSKSYLIIGTVCNHTDNLSFSERKIGGYTWILRNGFWKKQRLGVIEHNYISGIKRTPDGKVYFFTSYPHVANFSSRLFVYEDGRFKPVGNFNHEYNDPTGPLDLITDMEVDRNGKLWISTNHNGVFRIEGDTFDIHLFASEFVKSLGFTEDNKLIYCTNSGTFVHTDAGEVKISSLTDVYTISTDQNGHIWLGDISNGFEVYNRNFRLLFSSDDFYFLPSQSVRSIVHFGKYHLIGTDNGVVILNDRKVDRVILPDVVIRSLVIGPYSYLWILSGSGLYVIDTRTWSTDYFYSPLNSGLPADTRDVGPNSFYYKLIRDDIAIDPPGHSVWVGTTNGLARLELNIFWNYSGSSVKPVIFPSPVKSGDKFITISGIENAEDIYIFGMDGSKKRVDYIIGDGFVRVDISEFAPGTYFIVVDGKKLKFSVIR